MPEPDVIEWLVTELDSARQQAARQLDRAEAGAELLLLADAAAGGLNRVVLSPQQFSQACRRTEKDRARLLALLNRFDPDKKGKT